MEKVSRYAGWRWIFIIEGLLAAVITGIRLLFIPGHLEDSAFLKADEKAYMLKMFEVRLF